MNSDEIHGKVIIKWRHNGKDGRWESLSVFICNQEQTWPSNYIWKMPLRILLILCPECGTNSLRTTTEQMIIIPSGNKLELMRIGRSTQRLMKRVWHIDQEQLIIYKNMSVTVSPWSVIVWCLMSYIRIPRSLICRWLLQNSFWYWREVITWKRTYRWIYLF